MKGEKEETDMMTTSAEVMLSPTCRHGMVSIHNVW
jgi:hypothetical protein